MASSFRCKSWQTEARSAGMDDIRTERLLMRGWDAGDSQALADIMTPEVARWLRPGRTR
jgi:hypothetical protein